MVEKRRLSTTASPGPVTRARAINIKRLVSFRLSCFREMITDIHQDGTAVKKPVREGVRPRGPPHNFKNSGCMCYRNSALQLLLNLPPILDWLRSHTACDVEHCLACALKALASRYSTEGSLDLHAQVDSFFKTCITTGRFWISSRHGPFRPHNEQCDSSEFLEQLLVDMAVQSSP